MTWLHFRAGLRLADYLSSTIICKLNTYAIDFFYYLYISLFFALPVYYASQGSAVLRDAETCSAYQQRLSRMTVTAPSTELQAFQSNSTQASPCESPELAWNSYLDSRLAEWKVIFTLACVFIALVNPILYSSIPSLWYSIESISVTAFQIPQVIGDPLTRFFACLAVYRTFTGLIYTPIFSLYFNSKFARSVHFTFLLSKVCWIGSERWFAHCHYFRIIWNYTVYYHFLLPPHCGKLSLDHPYTDIFTLTSSWSGAYSSSCAPSSATFGEPLTKIQPTYSTQILGYCFGA